MITIKDEITVASLLCALEESLPSEIDMAADDIDSSIYLLENVDKCTYLCENKDLQTVPKEFKIVDTYWNINEKSYYLVEPR